MLAANIEPSPRFISTLAAPLAPQDELARIPLAITGRWVRGTREFAITRDDLDAIVRNFRGRQNGEINVDYDHASEMPEVAAGGPIPSAGRIVKMDPPEKLKGGNGKSEVRNGEDPDFHLPTSNSRLILWGWYEPTDRARRLIANREYRYISPAIDWSARSKKNGKPLGATLSTVALTNRPFLEEMPPIRLSDPEFRLVDEAVAIHQPTDRTDTAVEDDRNNAGGSMKKVQLSVVDGSVKIIHENQEFFADPADVKTCAKALASEGVPQLQ